MDAAADPAARRTAQDDGFPRRPAGVRGPHGPTDGRDRVLGRLQRLVRVARRAHRDEPPLRAGRASVQLETRPQPDGRRLPREDTRRRALERARLARLRHGRRERRHRRHRGKGRPEDHRPQALRHRRASREGEDGRVRKGRPALHGRSFLRWPKVVRGRPDGDPGRPARLRARRPASATSAARRTTGSGPATRATGPSTAPTSRRTARPLRSRRTTSPTSRSTGSRSRPRARTPATSSSSRATRAAPTA